MFPYGGINLGDTFGVTNLARQKNSRKLLYLTNLKETPIMSKTTIIGIDLAKSVFQVARLNSHYKLTSNQPYSRKALRQLIAQHPPVIIGMEACGSAHYWAKTFTKMGHQVKLFPPSYFSGLVYGNKHDANDAVAIAIAVTLPDSPTVAVKSDDQLALQALMRVRERRIKNRTQCANQIRGLLLEHGVVVSAGHPSLMKLSCSLETVPELIRPVINELLLEFKFIDQRVNASNKEIKDIVYNHPCGKALLELPGFGVLNALAGLIINPADFKNGRHYSAYLGLVPKQAGTGGQIKTIGLSKRGNRYHRKILCDGARAFLNCNKDHTHALWIWAKQIQQRKGHNTAVVALANKLAKISWHVLNGEPYELVKALPHQN